MLNGAEDILREEGYAALTSRRIAERIGVKQRLVYYYFPTMENLIVETFRRLVERELPRLDQALQSDKPLREVWDICIHTTDARLISEFIALANHIEALRTEVIAYVEKSREVQIAALTAALKRAGRATKIPPAAIALLASSLALALNREAVLGVTMGHGEAIAAVEQFFQEFEPGEKQ
jgi:AcrR family transcriptional regulator